MDKLKGKIAVELTIEQVNEINALIERNKPRALKKYVYSDPSLKPTSLCPACEHTLILTDSVSFCPRCGQALDKDNYEL